ncbi:MAG TPA: phage tail protein [Chloroflexota bacterium]|nr:phage tail protein [Chloroflexota bacterium]
MVARLGSDTLAADGEPATLGQTTIAVEPGTTAYTTIAAGPGPADLQIRVLGLQNEWFSLADDSLSLPPRGEASVELHFHPPADARLGPYPFSVEIRDVDGRPGITVTGLLRIVGSRLLNYLPRMFRGPEHELLGRFLLIFQRMLEPIERTIDNRAYYLDPAMAPAAVLPWLAAWLDLAAVAELDERRQRELIARAVELYRWKGTRRGMRAELELRTGARALVVEHFDGLRLGQDSAMGLNTQLGQPIDGSVVVTLVWPHTPDVDERRRADELVSEIKPAHVGHVVRNLSAMGSKED